MEKRQRIEKIRRDLKELEALETAEKKRELEELGEKQAEDELRILCGADREMPIGREASIERDELSDFDPFEKAWKEDVLAAQKKNRKTESRPGEEFELGDINSAKTVKVSRDELSEYGPFGQ